MCLTLDALALSSQTTVGNHEVRGFVLKLWLFCKQEARRCCALLPRHSLQAAAGWCLCCSLPDTPPRPTQLSSLDVPAPAARLAPLGGPLP
jgi:hypothetical protein